MAKWKKGDRVFVVNRDADTLWDNMVRRQIGIVQRTTKDEQYVLIRTEGNNLLEGKGLQITVKSDELVPDTPLTRLLYGE